MTIFSFVCLVIAWLRSRDRAGGSRSWRRRVKAMGWGLLLLPIAWIAMWLFGVNPATVGLLLLSGAVLILAPSIAADLAAVLLILLGLYGLGAAFTVFKHGQEVTQVAKAVPFSVTAQAPAGAKAAIAKTAAAHPKAIVISGGQGDVTAVPDPGVIVPGTPKSASLHQAYVEKITSLHKMAVPWSSSGIRPSPWYAALTGAGPQGYVPVLLAAFLFLAFGLWLVPRTLGARGALVGRLTSRVQRLSETRTDAVDTAAAELRRVERDLHDGAQARLVALGMSLRAAERLIETSPKAALALVGEARVMSSRALTELRDLVRGIHPPVLADRGLGDAVRALALETPVATRLDIDLPGRLAAPVESAAYFAVAEVLANAAKHAQAQMVEIHMRHTGDVLRIAMTDDGVGGADPAKGSGLRGVERRLGTFDGILAVNSPPGGPTIIVIEVPCASSSLKTSSC
ncbi:MAG TPA: histidine kinase [Streptosporangiaceae bacterium]|nr:histidine kinase [Streptosporangiaceae bacterium]